MSILQFFKKNYFTPFLISPKGEKICSAPSPLGEGWDGGHLIIQI
jgi:hypothetical protein